MKFEPGIDQQHTNLVFTILDDTLNRLMYRMTPDFNDIYNYGYLFCEFRYGPRFNYAALIIEPKTRRVFIEIANTPMHDDLFDGTSPFWSSPRPDLWIDMVPAVRNIMNGDLPPNSLYCHAT